MTILENLRNLMDRDHVNQSDLARVLGKDRSAITHLFQGNRQLKAEEAKAISKAFNWEISSFFNGEAEMKNYPHNLQTGSHIDFDSLKIFSRAVLRICQLLEVELPNLDALDCTEELYAAAEKIVREKLNKIERE